MVKKFSFKLNDVERNETVYVFFNIHADSVNLAFSDKDGDIEVSASREDSRKIAQTLAQALAPAYPLIDKSDRELLYEFTKFSVA